MIAMVVMLCFWGCKTMKDYYTGATGKVELITLYPV
jgi:hypothetical protein